MTYNGEAAMPTMITRTSGFGISEPESQDDLNKMGDLFARIEQIRMKAGLRIRVGDVVDQQTPECHIQTFAHSNRAMLLDIPIRDKIMSPVVRRARGAK